jgi:hypothetical protein
MKMYWAFFALAGTLGFLILFLADREREAGVERLSNSKTVPHSAIEADPELGQQTERSPYMPNERH